MKRIVLLLIAATGPICAEDFTLPSTSTLVFQSCGGSCSSTYINRNSNANSSGEPRDALVNRIQKSDELVEYEQNMKEFHALLSLKLNSRKVQKQWLAFAQHSGWSSAWYNYAQAAWNLGDKAEAARIFAWTATNCESDKDVCTASQNNLSELQYEMGHDAFVAGDYNAALSHYLARAQLTPLDPHSWHNVSVSYYRLGRWQEAADTATKSLSLTDAGDSYEKETWQWKYETQERVEWVAAVNSYNAAGAPQEGWMEETEHHLMNAYRYEDQTGVAQPDAHALQAWVFHAEGNDEAAEFQAQIALKQDPGNANARKFMCLKHAGAYCQ
jgi:hypothetical protein